MKRFTAAALEIVRRIVEGTQDEDFTDDVKDVMDLGQDDYWQQIDGDANPWLYGGSWFNPGQKRLIHFEGIEMDKDVEPDDVEIPATMLAKLPPEQEDWRENHERDKIIRDYQYARAAFLNARKPRTFWTIPADADYLGAYGHGWDKYEKHCPTGISDEDWQRLPLINKVLELGRYFGMENIGDQFKMNYKEVQALLGPKSI